MANKRESGLHKGHRQRVKQRADSFGLGAFSTHEAIELLLTYVIPRRDLNEISHVLLKTFGSFYNILNADKQDLMKVNGIGKESALFLKLLPQYFDLYKESKEQGKVKLGTTARCVEYFRNNYDINDFEEAYLIMLNDKEELIKIIPASEYSKGHEVEIDDALISKEIDSRRPKYVTLLHTHPNGDVKPSAEDLSSTVKIMLSCKNHNTRVVDHIIFNKSRHFSFKDNNVMSELETIANSKLVYLKVDNPKEYKKILEIIDKDNI